MYLSLDDVKNSAKVFHICKLLTVKYSLGIQQPHGGGKDSSSDNENSEKDVGITPTQGPT